MIEWQGSERGVKADSQVSGLEVLCFNGDEKRNTGSRAHLEGN